ncbi:hypothetical protein SAMN05421505_104192 [Sinosporangium album]|uniref:Uncharacterized protein n=1 Tax=Sinosporangium album TaxID=504805 RepID=A0A1G7UE03_9ACTN|nr:hypothetical protein [Sinosporangium album]SDG45000.1 hypothetical protein SAMN05421505_104192 [Sinosporangium album]
MDSASQGAADLLTGLGQAAVRFGNVGRAVHQAHQPFVRWEPFSRLSRSGVATGMVFVLPDGREVCFEVGVAMDGQGFRVRGEVSDEGERLVELPVSDTANVRECLVVLRAYVGEVTGPARRILDERMAALHEPD